MACVTEIRLNDVGTRIQFTFKQCIDNVTSVVDISAADSIEIKLRKPEAEDGTPGTLLTKVGTKTNGGADGIAHYDTVSGDMDELGKWTGQGKAIMTIGTQEFSSDVISFKVVENI